MIHNLRNVLVTVSVITAFAILLPSGCGKQTDTSKSTKTRKTNKKNQSRKEGLQNSKIQKVVAKQDSVEYEEDMGASRDFKSIPALKKNKIVRSPKVKKKNIKKQYDDTIGLGGGAGGDFGTSRGGDSLARVKSGKQSSETERTGINTELVFIPRHRVEPEKKKEKGKKTTTGQLIAFMKKEEKKEQRGCPLEKTEVSAEIDGMVATVSVNQRFQNPFQDKIEAVYKFPLPHSSAINGFRMKIGDRTIRGVIRKKEKAKELYRKAKAKGHRASLLTQDRPNVFEEKVANITPGETIEISIDFFQYVTYEHGEYQWVFPLVVGPRYAGGSSSSRGKPNVGIANPRIPQGKGNDGDQAGTAGGDQDVNPKLSPPEEIPGHSVNLSVDVSAGIPVQSINSPSHRITIHRENKKSNFSASIKSTDTLPNKDFILRWRVRPEDVQMGMFTNDSERGKFFSVLLQPPVEKNLDQEMGPLNWIFVVDRSGSMKGQKMAATRNVASDLFKKMRPKDTVSLLTFSNSINVHIRKAQVRNKNTLPKMQNVISSLKGGGGTRLPKALNKAKRQSSDKKRRNVYVVISDALHGREARVLREVRRDRNSRYFFIAAGQSPNRFLADRLAEIGNGAAWAMRSDEDTVRILEKFENYLQEPVLRDIRISWKGLKVTNVYPAADRVPDLFADRPLFVTGRVKKITSKNPKMILKGDQGDRKISRTISVSFEESTRHKGIETLWARLRIKELMNEFMTTRKQPKRESIKKKVTALGLDYSLMTQFTSFVAVDSDEKTKGGKPRTVEVPVHLPEGMEYDEITGKSATSPMKITSRLIGINLEVTDRDRMEVTGIHAGSPAGKQNLKAGATVEAINKRKQPTGADLRKALNGWSSGETLSITFRQDGQLVEIRCTLQENEK